MKMKKLAVVLPVLLTVGAVGCSSQPKSTSQSGGGTIKEATTITFWNTSSYESTINAFVEAFKAVEPNVTVNAVKQSAGYSELAEMVEKGIPANDYPDMMLGYPDAFCTLMNYGVVTNLQPYMDNAEYGWTAQSKNDVIKAYIEEGQSYPVEGTYSLPMAKSTEAMYYNESVVIGLDLHNEDASINGGKPLTAAYLASLTWEEMFDKLCPAIIAYNDKLPSDQKIIKSDYSGGHCVIGYDSDENIFITLAKQYGYGYTSVDKSTGKGVIEFNNAGMKQLMTKWNEYYKKGYIHTQGTSGNYTNYIFTAENCLFTIGSTGGSKYQVCSTFDTGVTKIPTAAGKDKWVINQGPSIGVLNHKAADGKSIDKNRELASWLFYKFMTNETNAVKWACDSGYSPIRTSTFSSDEYIDLCKTEGKTARSEDLIKAKVASYVGTVGEDLYASDVFKGSAKARTEVGKLVTSVLKDAALDATKLDAYFKTAEDNTKLAM